MSAKTCKDPEKYRERQRVIQRRARAKIREIIRAIKIKATCRDCGETHPACLQFHHRDPALKVMSINRFVSQKRPNAMLYEEIAKCDVLCANCHAKRHFAEREHVARSEPLFVGLRLPSKARLPQGGTKRGRDGAAILTAVAGGEN